MGWFSKAWSSVKSGASKLGHKISHGASYLGKKAYQGAKIVYNYGLDHAEDIGKIAGKVGDVAGKIQQGATALGGVISATGVGAPLGAFIEGVGGVAGGVSKGAGLVQKGATAVEEMKKKGVLTRATRRGGFGGAIHLDRF